MSKRWKVRKANAAKIERSHEVIEQFYDNVITGLEQMAERVKAMTPEELAVWERGTALEDEHTATLR